MHRKKTMEELQRLSKDEMLHSAKRPFVVVLDQVRSMQNVGAIFRTADAFAIEEIILCGYTPTPPHRDIHKTALGATETVKWQHQPRVTMAIETLRENGYAIIAIEQVHASTALQNFSALPKMALVFGNEVTGVSDEALALCDGVVEIPQLGSKHSLNLSVSVGIVLWELVRESVVI